MKQHVLEQVETTTQGPCNHPLLKTETATKILITLSPNHQKQTI